MIPQSEPVAIRRPERGKAHRSTLHPNAPQEYAGLTACGRPATPMTEQIPLAQTDPADRCTRCWTDRTRD